MKKLMKMTLLLAFAASVTGALAWDVTVPETNDTATVVMLVPPVVEASELSQIPVRGSNVAVVAGAKYRIGSQVIVAAHAGNMTNTMVTTTAYYTNGIPAVLAAAQWAATNGVPVYTNIYTVLAPISVPAAGLSGYDGSVRWYRARTADQEDVRLQIAVAGGTVSLRDNSGSTLGYAAAATVDFLDFNGALYVYKDATNACSAKAMAW